MYTFLDFEDRVELIEMSAGTVENQEVDASTFDEWHVPDCPRHQGRYDFVNVMWIERKGDVAYRKALGRVEKNAWSTLTKVMIHVILG